MPLNHQSPQPLIPEEEEKRLGVLRSYGILDTPQESDYEDPVTLAAQACDVPVALVTFVDADRVWIKAAVGVDVTEVPRNTSFCAHVVEARSTVVIEDARLDPRVARSPLVTGPQGVRFYAGTPLISPDGAVIGTVCVLDRSPRTMTDGQRRALESIGRLVMARLELRRSLRHLEEVLEAQRRVDEGLAASEQKLRALIETAGEGITLSDESGRFEVFNPKMTEITGYTKEEASAAKDFSRLLYPKEEDHQRALDGLKELLAKGSMREVETVIRTKSGEAKTLLVSTTTMATASGTMFLSLYHDITLRKRAEEALAESQGRFRVMFESNPLPCWVFDYDSLKFLEVNEAMVRHYGFTRDELLEMQITEIRPPEELPRLTNVLREVRYRPAYHTQMRHRAKDGRQFDVHISWNTFWYERRRAVLVVAEDISELNRRSEDLEKAMEAAEQANRAKTEFLATMSHELRTPLNGVIGTTSLLMETPLSAEQRDYLETIRTSGVALLAIINDILTLSRLESGSGEVEESPVQPEETIETVLDMFATEADAKGIDLLCWVDVKVPPVVRTVATRLRQVLVNLVSNGIKFTERGHVAVAVSLKKRTTDTAELEFAVSDTGTGIPADRLDRLFKPFSQADMSSTRKFGGTGLGLAIASRIVELMHGHIRVETMEGRGSTFFFTIPVQPVHTEMPRTASVLAGKNIWVLEDNPLARTILQKLFASHGASIRTATSIEELAELAGAGSGCDLVVTNDGIVLDPGKDLFAELRTRFGHEVPTVVTGFMSRRTALSSLIPPSARFLPKPVRHSTLIQAATQLVSGIASRSASVPVPPTAAPLQVLVAEDNAVNQKIMVRMLKTVGHDADVAANGVEVLDAVRRKKYDILFLDLHMPEMDGIEAARQIAAVLPAGERPYIIAMTAYVDDTSRQQCLDVGMNDYLTKPVLIDDVRDALARAAGSAPPFRSASQRRTSGVLEDVELRARLDELGADGEPAFMRELVQAFLSEVPRMLDGIESALRTKNSRALQEDAHALKGSSMNIGASRLAALARTLEDLGRLRQPIPDDLTSEALHEEFDRVHDQLMMFIESLK